MSDLRARPAGAEAAYSASYPPSILPVTGATAGIPGSFTPASGKIPDSPAAMAQSNPVKVTASPLTAWTSGQYVQTATAGAAGRASWTGTSWVSGAAPLEFDPNEHTVAEVQEWAATAADEDKAAALEAEVAGKNRSTAITALGGQT